MHFRVVMEATFERDQAWPICFFSAKAVVSPSWANSSMRSEEWILANPSPFQAACSTEEREVKSGMGLWSNHHPSEYRLGLLIM
jgi:hypothetical protein